jgi:hypothetical protein
MAPEVHVCECGLALQLTDANGKACLSRHLTSVNHKQRQKIRELLSQSDIQYS